MPAARPFKIPRSVLVVIGSADGHVLLLERADAPGFWQSVTGSLDRDDEPLRACCRREVAEETGIDAAERQFTDLHRTVRYEIYARWRHRYAPGVTHNTEHAFALVVPRTTQPVLAAREHVASQWLPAAQAAQRCFSPSNADAIRAWAGLPPEADRPASGPEGNA